MSEKTLQDLKKFIRKEMLIDFNEFMRENAVDYFAQVNQRTGQDVETKEVFDQVVEFFAEFYKNPNVVDILKDFDNDLESVYQLIESDRDEIIKYLQSNAASIAFYSANDDEDTYEYDNPLAHEEELDDLEELEINDEEEDEKNVEGSISRLPKWNKR